MAAPPLLLINGYAATAADWDPTFIAALERSFELILPDNRGVGAAPLGELDRPLTIEAMAVRSPQRVEALVLLSTDPGSPNAVLADTAAWAQLTDNSGSPRDQATRLISLLFPPAVAAAIDRQFGDAVAVARAELSPAALSAQVDAMEAWHATERPPPPAPAPPVLIAHGSEDVVVPPTNSDRLAAHWPNSRVERFADGGHAFMAQEPERLADLITSFLLQ